MANPERDLRRAPAALTPGGAAHADPVAARVFGSRRQDVALAAIVLLAIALMLVPVPTAVVDLLLAGGLALGLLMLSSVVLLVDPLRLTAFPSLLIIATLIRLAANVSTTRLILGGGDGGAVVRAFGNVVFADSVVVGLVVFALITVIQFVVIARGAERIAEVTARFMLDALPGKQQAIDADLRNGAIDRFEASRRRARLATESQFFGAMDGAMKFIKGDAIATVIVVMINLAGGMIIALGQQGMSLAEAAATYSVLSIGEGLAAQVPALMAAAAAGILVARRAREAGSTEAEGALGYDVFAQLGATPAAWLVSGGVLGLLAVLPGLPVAPFAILAACCLLAAYGRKIWRPRRAQLAAASQLWHGVEVPQARVEPGLRWPVHATSEAPETRAEAQAPGGEAIYVLLGEALASALTNGTMTAALAALTQARGQIAQRLGFELPPIILISPSSSSLAPVALPAVSLASSELCVVWRGSARSWQRIDLAAAVVRAPAEAPAPAPAPVPVPVPVDAAARLADAVARGLLEAAHALITTEVTRAWCAAFAATPHRAALVGEVLPARLTYAELTELLRELVREHVGLGDLELILRAIATAPAGAHGAAARLARIRLALSDQITQSLAAGHELKAWHIDPLAEDALRDAIAHRGEDAYLALAPDLAQALVAATKQALSSHATAALAMPPAIVVADDLRRHVRALFYPELPLVAVIAHGELRPSAIVVPRGLISI